MPKELLPCGRVSPNPDTQGAGAVLAEPQLGALVEPGADSATFAAFHEAEDLNPCRDQRSSTSTWFGSLTGGEGH